MIPQVVQHTLILFHPSSPPLPLPLLPPVPSLSSLIPSFPSLLPLPFPPPPSLLPPVCRNNSCLADRYHPGTVNGNKYTCCSGNKQEEGCQDTYFKMNKGLPFPTSTPGAPGSALPYKQSYLQPSTGGIQYQSAQTYGQQLRQHKQYGGAVGRGQHELAANTHNGEESGCSGKGRGGELDHLPNLKLQ